MRGFKGFCGVLPGYVIFPEGRFRFHTLGDVEPLRQKGP